MIITEASCSYSKGRISNRFATGSPLLLCKLYTYPSNAKPKYPERTNNALSSIRVRRNRFTYAELALENKTQGGDTSIESSLTKQPHSGKMGTDGVRKKSTSGSSTRGHCVRIEFPTSKLPAQDIRVITRTVFPVTSSEIHFLHNNPETIASRWNTISNLSNFKGSSCGDVCLTKITLASVIVNAINIPDEMISSK
jgi:hypothetical protein